jgi:long-subunit fatty acid transport protein
LVVEMKHRHPVRIGVLCAALLVSPLVAAQTAIEPPVVNPGARSLGLGGAFVAVADDATAAYANPSGLVQLSRPEISLELRGWSDSREGTQTNVSGVGFASFVMPIKRWSIAIFGQTIASLEFANDLWRTDNEVIPLSTLAILNVGVSAAVRVSDSVSLGVGLLAFGGGVGETGLDTSSTQGAFAWEDSSTDSGVAAGLLWNLSDAWSLGASYRSGADFQFEGERRAALPDVLAIGTRWRSPGGNATLAFEVEQLGGIDDRIRVHAGGEWVFLSTKPLIGLRAGLWNDPSGGAASSETNDGVIHAAAGIGFAFKHVQLDLGVDTSDRATIGSISAIFTF